MRWLLLIVLLSGGAIAFAQETPVTDDEVNAIAAKMYCPVCENIPLDTCGTLACVDWRNEIRMMLEDGQSEQEVIDDFVRRFGDRVVGVPQSTAPRLLSTVTPYLLFVIGIGLAIATFMTWRKGDKSKTSAPVKKVTSATQDIYQQQLEHDLQD